MFFGGCDANETGRRRLAEARDCWRSAPFSLAFRIALAEPADFSPATSSPCRTTGRAVVVNEALTPPRLSRSPRAVREDFACASHAARVALPIVEAVNVSRTNGGQSLRLHKEGTRCRNRYTHRSKETLRRDFGIGERLGSHRKRSISQSLRTCCSFRILPETDSKSWQSGGTLCGGVAPLCQASGPSGEITLSHPPGGHDSALSLLSKAGGFGGNDLLGRVKDYLRSNER